MKSALILLLLISCSAFAQGTQGIVYDTLIRSELKGWTHPKTGSTVQLLNQCGVDMELHLVGNHRSNLLLIGITNGSADQVVVKYREIQFTFDDGKSRFPGATNDMNDQLVGVNWWQITWVPFPSKDDFKTAKLLNVKVPVVSQTTGKTCFVEAEFNRTKHVPEEEISYSAFEVILDGGPSLAQLGNVKELGKPSGLVSMEFNFYPIPKHGFGMVFSNEFNFDGGENTRVDSKLRHGADLSYLGLQYVFRHHFREDLYLSFGIGAGMQFISDKRNDSRRNDDIRTDFAMADKLMLNWVFHQFSASGAQRLDLFTGTGVAHFWAPSASINGQDVSGQRFSWIFRIGMGF